MRLLKNWRRATSAAPGRTRSRCAAKLLTGPNDVGAPDCDRFGDRAGFASRAKNRQSAPEREAGRVRQHRPANRIALLVESKTGIRVRGFNDHKDHAGESRSAGIDSPEGAS